MFVTFLALEHRVGNVVFDCVKAKDESEGSSTKVLPFFEKHKVPNMKKNDKIIAQLGKNLTIQEPEPEKDNELQFFSPEHESHVSNKQEYAMVKVHPDGQWKAIVHYFHRTEDQQKEVCHMWYQVPPDKPSDEGPDAREETSSSYQNTPGWNFFVITMEHTSQN